MIFLCDSHSAIVGPAGEAGDIFLSSCDGYEPQGAIGWAQFRSPETFAAYLAALIAAIIVVGVALLAIVQVSYASGVTSTQGKKPPPTEAFWMLFDVMQFIAMLHMLEIQWPDFFSNFAAIFSFTNGGVPAPRWALGRGMPPSTAWLLAPMVGFQRYLRKLAALTVSYVHNSTPAAVSTSRLGVFSPEWLTSSVAQYARKMGLTASTLLTAFLFWLAIVALIVLILLCLTHLLFPTLKRHSDFLERHHLKLRGYSVAFGIRMALLLYFGSCFVLVLGMTLSIYSAPHYTGELVVSIVILLAYGFGFPALILWLFWGRAIEHHSDEHFKRQFGALYSEYRPGAALWSIPKLLCKFLFACATALLRGGPIWAIFQTISLVIVQSVFLQRLSVTKPFLDPALGHIEMLTQSNKLASLVLAFGVTICPVRGWVADLLSVLIIILQLIGLFCCALPILRKIAPRFLRRLGLTEKFLDRVAPIQTEESPMMGDHTGRLALAPISEREASFKFMYELVPTVSAVKMTNGTPTTNGTMNGHV